MRCNRRNGFVETTTRLGIVLVLLALAVPCRSLWAQTSAKSAAPALRSLNHPAAPTGQLGFLATFRDKNPAFQPVQWKLPEGVKVEIARPGVFQEAPDGSNEFALQIGRVYRFRISNIATYPGRELYPTLEMLGRLNPPEGKEWDFPVEIEVPTRDLALALRGNFVTRVVFVENSENAMNVDAGASSSGLVFDVPQSVDAVAAANLRGRALAILRVGSRSPDAEPSQDDPFFFGLPDVAFRPVPGAAPSDSRTDELTPETTDGVDDFQIDDGSSDAPADE